MSEQNINTNITATANFSALTSQLNAVTAGLIKLQATTIGLNSNLSNQMGIMNRSFAETMRSTGQFSTHFVTLSGDVNQFGKNLDSGRMKLGQYFNTWQGHAKKTSTLVKDLAKQQVMLENAIIKPLGRNAQGLMQYNVMVGTGLDVVKNKTALLAQEQSIMNKIMKDGSTQLVNWGKNTQWAGRQLTVGLTVPLMMFGTAAAKAFREADQELVRLTKVYGGLTATSSADLLKIRNDVSSTAKMLAASYGSSYKETISLAADIAATGKEGQDLIKSTIQTSRLAVLGEIDRQEAMKATLAIQNTFKQNTDELTQSIDFLNAVENQTSTSLADLTQAIPKAGPVVQALGGSVKDLALYLTAMKEGGVEASQGANAIKSALASLINPTKVAKDMFTGFGIDLGGIITRNAGNLTGTIMELQKSLDTLDPLSKSRAIEQLFGKFQFARMSALFENLGKQGSQTLKVLDLMKASTTDLASISARELTQMTQSASGKYKIALESVKADLAAVGEKFLVINTFVLKTVDGIVKFVGNLPGPIKQILTLVGGLTAVAGPLIMLTGVLGNFFGYIVKGVFSLKSLFKGTSGFKLLTPEIMAAADAGKTIEQVFYSDAKAAMTFADAVNALANSFVILQQKALAATTVTGGGISTVAGNAVMSSEALAVNNERMAVKNHPLAGPIYTRDMVHMNPTALMSPEQRSNQSIFSVVPGPNPVNKKIGANPQSYMHNNMPLINGVTAVNGVSTGVVAGEAAKWHAMNAAIATQSEAELAMLKTELITNKTVTAELAASYQAMLPPMAQLTSLAAAESQAIVSQLQAGKITVDAARAKIIALNANVEAMMIETATMVASSMSRTINLTTVPLTSQPVVGAGGKSNMKEMFHKGPTASLVDTIARSLGVKTSGAPFSIETTVPKTMRRFATGGPVYRVLGSGEPEFKPMGTDTVPAMLTPGEFVVNAKATKENLGLLQQINGPGSKGPYQSTGSSDAIDFAPMVPTTVPRISGVTNEQMSSLFPERFAGGIGSYRLRGTAGVYLNEITDPKIIHNEKYKDLVKNGKISKAKLNAELAGNGLPTEVYKAAMAASQHQHVGSTDQFLSALAKAGIINEKDAMGLQKEIDSLYRRHLDSFVKVKDASNPYWAASNTVMKRHLFNNPDALGFWDKFSSEPAYAVSENLRKSGEPMRSPSMKLKSITHNGKTIKLDALESPRAKGFFAHTTTPPPLLKRVFNAGITAVENRRATRMFRNRGGIIGMSSGGMVPGAGVQHFGVGGMAKKFGRGAAGFGAGIVGQEVAGNIASRMGVTNGIASTAIQMGGFFAAQSAATKLVSRSLRNEAIPALETLSESAAKSTGALSRIAPALGRAGLFASRFAGPIGVVAIGLQSALMMYKKHQDSLKLQALAYGMTADSAKKAGLSINVLSSEIKNAIANQKALAETNRLIYATTTLSNTPLKITIEEYRKLKEEVKKTLPEYINLINATKKQDIGKLAISLKAQFITAGMSAEEATKKVYALIAASNKYGQGVSSISQPGFASVNDQKSAAIQNIKTLAIGQGLNVPGENQANQFFITLQGISAAIDEVKSKSETLAKADKTGNTIAITKLEAQQQVLKAIENSKVKQNNLTEKNIAQIAKINPDLAGFLNTTDNTTTAWAKLNLLVEGTRADIHGMSGDAASALQVLNEAIAAAAKAALIAAPAKDGTGAGILYKTNSQIDALQKKIKQYALESAGISVQKQIDSRKALDAINAQIDAINKEAEARKKALEDINAMEDENLQIKKAQIIYQQAVASGDMAAAAQAQIDIQSLTNARQKTAAINAIEQARIAKVEPLQAKAKGIDSANQAISDAASLAAEKLAAANAKLDVLVQAFNGVAKSFTDIQKNIADLGDKYLSSSAYTDDIAALVQALKSKSLTPESMGIKPTATAIYGLPGGSKSGVGTRTKSADEIAAEAISKATDAYKNGIKADKVIITATNSYNTAQVKDSPKVNAKIETSPASKLTTGYKDGKPVMYKAGKGELITADDSWVQKAIYDRGYKKIEPGAFFQDSSGTGYEVVKLVKDSTGASTIIFKPSAHKFAMGGSVKRYEPGGKVTGPGTATSDSIPAMLSDGEYVFSARAVNNAGGPDAVDSLHNALKKAEGGPIASWMKPKSSYNSKNQPTGNPRGRYWGELERLYQQSPLGFDKNGKPIFNNAGKDPWGGTEIPGLPFSGKVANFSDYFHQLAEQPKKSSGPLMGLDKSPDRYAGSGASMGGIGGGAYGMINSLFMHKGGAVGHKHGVAGLWDKFKNQSNQSMTGSMMTGILEQLGTVGQSILSSLVPSIVPKTSKKQNKDLQEFSGVPSVYRSVSGKTSESPFSIQTGNKSAGKWMDYLSAATMFLPTKGVVPAAQHAALGEVANKAANASLKNFMQGTSATKQLINSIYKRKDLTIDKQIYPTYNLKGKSEKFAFEGYEENLSKIADSGIRVVKTTPESLLQEALRLNSGNKNLQILLDNFKSNKIGKQERLFLDEITASTGINNKGKPTYAHQTDGFAMILAALSGDKNAQNIINVKRGYMYDVIKKAKKDHKDRYVAEDLGLTRPDVEPITTSDVSVIHSTKYPIVKDKDGNMILYPHGQHVDKSRVPRASLHTSLDGPVQSHMMGSWSNAENKIISPLSSMIKDNGMPYNLNSIDTWWSRSPGKALKISNGIAIRPFTSHSEYTKALIEAGVIKKGDKAPLLAVNDSQKEIVRLHKEKFTEADVKEIEDLITKFNVSISHRDIIGNENQILDNIATLIAKRKIGTTEGLYRVDGWSLSSKYRQDQIDLLTNKLKVRAGIHSGSGPERLESHLMKSDNKDNWNMLSQLAPESLDSIRFLTLFGRLKTQIRKVEDPDERFLMADGGYVGKRYNIPQFETGVNSVPVDMLAMLHKNEAVVPANMNPFNPNAPGISGYNKGGSVNHYNVGGMVINTQPGQDEKMIATMVVDMLDKKNMINSAMLGNSRSK